MKRILLIGSLALALGGTPALAQGAGLNPQTTLPADSLIAYDEEQLVNALVRLVEARRASQQAVGVQTQAGQTSLSGLLGDESLMELLRLNMLFDLFGQKAEVQSASQPQVTLLPAPSSANAVNTSALQRRVAQLEALVQQLMLRQQGGQTITIQQPQERSAPTIIEPRVEQPALIQELAPKTELVQTTDTIRLTERELVLRDFKRSVYFPVGSYKITSQAKATLLGAVKVLREYPEVRLQLAGFASPEGNAKANATLAARRLATVKLFLETEGISSARLLEDTTGVDSSTIANELARRVDLSLAL